jgi:cell division protein FtsZ
MYHSDIIGPVLIVGLGGLGKKVAMEAKCDTGFDCFIISSDKRDLDGNNSLYVDCNPWMNPSVLRIRSVFRKHEAIISDIFSRYKTVIIISNLGGKAGSAISPLVCSIAKLSLCKVISLVVMPFRYEKERLFNSAVCLKRINSFSDGVFVLDNDAFLEINPDLSPEECFSITNNTLVNIIKLIPSENLCSGPGIISTSRPKEHSAEKALRDSIAMLYSSSDPDSLGKSFLLIGNISERPIGTLNMMVDKLSKMQNIDRIAEVNLLTSNNSDRAINLLTFVEGMAKFDSYDPLAVIPRENYLDWDLPDCHPNFTLPLTNIE